MISQIFCQATYPPVVTVVASSEWSQSNRDYSFNAVMDATTAKVGGWIQISTARIDDHRSQSWIGRM